MWVLAVLLLLVTAFLWIRRPQRPTNFPPGPPTFLIFGNLWTAIESIRGQFLESIKHCRHEFGDILGFVLPTGEKTVHICKFEDIKEACAMQEMSGRPNSFALLVRSFQQKLGVIFSEGPAWVEHRRFALRHLRDLGFGKNSMESTVLNEFEELSQEMKREIDSPMKVNFRFNLTVLNILWRLVADKRLESSDPKAQHYIATVNEFFTTIGPGNPMNLAPWLRHIAPEWSGYAPLIRHRETTVGMFHEVVHEHRQTLDRSSPRDFIDQFLLEMEKPDAEARLFTERNLSIIGMDLFIAGMETTSTSLSWALLFMVKHPEVQSRVQREIDAVLGGIPPTYGDRMRMPYTEATLMEVMRRSKVIPGAAPHCALSDISFRGYTIPKGTTVIMHLHMVHMDPAYWGDPEAFRPDRFLHADGSVRRDERLIPFGIGKRFCLGETLARMEMFMLFTCLLQRFSFTAVPGQKLSLEARFAVVQQPPEFFVTYKPRD
ncbi:methyl farnesoate epoxidase-like [Pollicipes pollicipes]|uniref:methyl farnesoate epoxidase-like n=1 Tax=Pollicipes pollicipes TaxID=41117 RepID=UPI0018854CC7|nr:methyl farnesoate epoxidase-like [Pollicipes pollicipes]